MGKRERKTELNDGEKIITEKHNSPPSFRFSLTSGNTVGATFLYDDGSGGNSFFGGSIYITNQRIIFEADSDLKSLTGSIKIISYGNIESSTHENDGFSILEKNGNETTFSLKEGTQEIYEYLKVIFRKSIIQKAKQCEEDLDYKRAIELWENIGERDQAKRIRKRMHDEGKVKVDQTVVHGDQVTKTEIKDSVLNRSNVGGGSSKIQELKDLTTMKEKGLIDDDEFKQMKNEILGK